MPSGGQNENLDCFVWKNNWQNDFEIANFITFRIPEIVVHL